MASEIPTSHLGGSLIQSEVRIVLLGDHRTDQGKIVKLLLGDKTLTEEKCRRCNLYTGVVAGRKISVVEAPGWNTSSFQQTSDSVKAEIIRSASLCPPGPDAFLLVFRVKDLSEAVSTREIAEALKHVELLQERVWKHTIVLFDCDEDVEESVLQKHMCNAGKSLEKCSGRFHVLHRGATQISKLIKKIENLMEDNGGDFYIPQNVFDMIQFKTQISVESDIRHRRGSLSKSPPSFEKGNVESDEKKKTGEVAKHMVLALDKSLIPLSVLVMAIIGALIGSVAGAEYGVLGACIGLASGVIVGVLLAGLIMYIYNKMYYHFFPSQPNQ